MKHFLTILAAVYALSACQQTVTIELPPHEPKLVLHALWSQGQNQQVWAWVGNNISILDNTRLDSAYYNPIDREIPYEGTVWVQNATVELYQNGLLFQTLRAESGSRVYTAPFLVDNLNPAANYELRVSAPNYPSISASINMAPPPSISNTTLTVGGVNRDGYIYDLIEVDINDLASTDNYYLFELKCTPKDTVLGNTPYYQSMESPEQNVEYSNNNLILSDKTFNGQTKRFAIWTFILNDYWVDLNVYNLDKNAYLFNRSLQLYYDAQNNPFAEPVIIYSNVKNGRGIAAGSSRVSFRLN